jgi:hypothetical protein
MIKKMMQIHHPYLNFERCKIRSELLWYSRQHLWLMLKGGEDNIRMSVLPKTLPYPPSTTPLYKTQDKRMDQKTQGLHCCTHRFTLSHCLFTSRQNTGSAIDTIPHKTTLWNSTPCQYRVKHSMSCAHLNFAMKNLNTDTHVVPSSFNVFISVIPTLRGVGPCAASREAI